MYGTPEYRSWAHMKSRCNNKNTPDYINYGGRGIGYSERWDQFALFFEDMGFRPSSDHSLDRIDNSKGYSKENCRWATSKEQNNNRRNVVLHKGKTLTEWASVLGIKRSTLAQRFYVYKWDIEKCLAN